MEACSSYFLTKICWSFRAPTLKTHLHSADTVTTDNRKDNQIANLVLCQHKQFSQNYWYHCSYRPWRFVDLIAFRFYSRVRHCRSHTIVRDFRSGFCKSAVALIRSFLYEREQYLQPCGKKSEYEGSIFGHCCIPYIHTSDIFRCVSHCKIVLYADFVQLLWSHISICLRQKFEY